MNELKSEIDIPDDAILKFKQFWIDFKDTPLKGKNSLNKLDFKLLAKSTWDSDLLFFLFSFYS